MRFPKFFFIFFVSASASASCISSRPRTATTLPSISISNSNLTSSSAPASMSPTTSSPPQSLTIQSILISTSQSTFTRPTPSPFIGIELKSRTPADDLAKAFLTPLPASNPTSTSSLSFTVKASPNTTPPPKVTVNSAGQIYTLISVTQTGSDFIGADGELVNDGTDGEGEEGESRLSLQLKWHLTTFTSCHTFDPTRIFCGVHEPVLPGGDEIAAAVRPLDAVGGIWRALIVVLGALVGVDVFLR